jgi:hypothetical protein
LPFVEEYWSGVLRRLQAEVQVFNRLIEHPGEKGRANEISLSQVIAKLIPGRYAIGSGMLIDSEDGCSAQTDIVVYNQTDYPTILAQTTQMLFPIENVRFCVEVKTTVSKREIVDALEKRAKMRSLSPRSSRHPAYALVGFEAEVSVERIAEHLSVPDTERLDLVCILRDGIVAGAEDLLVGGSEESSKYAVGIAMAPAVVQEHLKEVLRTRSARVVERSLQYNDTIYPIIRRETREHVASDPARALLLFCSGLLQWLAQSDTDGMAVLPHYIAPEARRLELLT